MTRIIVQFYENKEKTATIETDERTEVTIENHQNKVTVKISNAISDEDVPF